jgi:protein-S-isoprenylcysteine O-methyltransferase Ste14
MNRRLLALYPREWRDRYGAEVEFLVEELLSAGETTRARAALDLAVGAVVQRWRGAARRRVLVPIAVAAAILGGLAAVSLTVSHVVPGRAQPYFDTHLVGLLLPVAEAAWLVLEVVEFVRGRRSGYWPVGRRDWAAVGACLIGTTVAINLAPPLVPSAALRPGGVAFGVGLVVLAAGIGLRWWALRSHPQMDGEPAAFTGPYRLLRHPGRTGVLVAAVGIGLTSANWVGLAAMTLLPLALLLWRIRLLENALASALGERYDGYVGNRKRLVPLIW